MPVEAYTGSSSIGTTEWSLTTNTSGPDVNIVPGDYQLWANFLAMLVGDEYAIRLYEKVASADSQALVEQWVLKGVQAKTFVTPVFRLINGWDWTIDQLTGSARTITWSIRSGG